LAAAWVYRATDTVLKRQIALKVLPPEVANDPERVAASKVRRKSSLNHRTPPSSTAQGDLMAPTC
jgi:hypothetical protein